MLLRVLTGLVLVVFPLRILSYGYLPDDDALRHAAKAVSGKAWSEILLLRPEITIDHNPGWHVILSVAHHLIGWGGWELVALSVVTGFIAFSAAPLSWLKRSETWLASLALATVVFPYFAERVMLGRPLLIAMGITVALMSLWTRPGARPTRGVIALSTGLMAAAAWIHGSWYLLALLPAAFFLAQEWRRGWILTLCWLAGSVIGAILTGQPWAFLNQTARIPIYAMQLDVPAQALVREFQPFSATFAAIILVGVVIALRKWAKLPLASLWRDPVLCLALLGWLLGFQVVRFWLDWGLPAMVLWLARQGEELLDKHVPIHSAGRLAIAGVAGVVLILAVGSDRHARWSRWGTLDCLDTRRPEHAGWVPEPGGVLYNLDLTVFYQTFFRNPHGTWRYVLGFEPALMRAEDRAVYEELTRTLNAVRACAPWVKRMTAADRLVLLAGPEIRPNIPELEWAYAASNTWVGRLPRLDPAR